MMKRKRKLSLAFCMVLAILLTSSPMVAGASEPEKADSTSAEVGGTLTEVSQDISNSGSEQDRLEQVRSFVSRMYTVALGREAEEAGLNDWSNRLLNHETDGAGIANGFIMSEEFKNKNVDDENYVDILYHTFFNRDADEGGRTTWLETLQNGNSREFVLAGFVNSVEFDNLCNEYGIVRGGMENNEPLIKSGVKQFVNRCYLKVLGREGEKAGVEDWTGRIARGEQTPESVAKLFFFSEEYANKNTNNEEFVETLYQTFMDRASDPAGKSDWVGRLSGGASREEVLEGFSRSEEFAKIMQSFGLSQEPEKADVYLYRTTEYYSDWYTWETEEKYSMGRQFVYDADGRLCKSYERLSNERIYDANGNVIKLGILYHDSDTPFDETHIGGWYEYEYNAENICVKRKNYAYDAPILVEFDEEGKLIHDEYVIERYKEAELVELVEYDCHGNETKHTYYNERINSGINTRTENEYDEDGKLQKQTEYFESGFVETNYFEYDSAGKLIKIKKYQDGELEGWEEYTYDDKGRLTEQKEMDCWGGVENDAVIREGTIYEYDSDGNVIKYMMDTDGVAKLGFKNVYGENGKLVRHEEYFGLGSEPIRQEIYDSEGRITDLMISRKWLAAEDETDEAGNVVRRWFTEKDGMRYMYVFDYAER